MRQTKQERCSYWETSPGDFSFALLIPQLFFWLFPPGPEGSLDDLIFWYVVYHDPCLAWFVAQLSTLKDKWGSWLLVVRGFLPGKRSKLPADNSKDYI